MRGLLGTLCLLVAGCYAPPPYGYAGARAPSCPVVQTTLVRDEGGAQWRAGCGWLYYYDASGREDVSRRRPDPAVTPAPSSGGPVHVRGYHRRDGTYVRPHTRSRPR